MIEYRELVGSLRVWIKNGDAPVRAAVELLIEQGHWLRDRTFVDECIGIDESQMPAVRRAVAALTEPGDHMPTVPVVRVVAPRFPRLAAAAYWATTVGAIVAATVCFSVALLLIIGLRVGVLQP